MNKKYIKFISKLIFTIMLCIITCIQLMTLFYAFIRPVCTTQSLSGLISYSDTSLLPFGYITLIIYIAFLNILCIKKLYSKFFKYASIFIIIYLIVLFFIPVINIYTYNDTLRLTIDLYIPPIISTDFTIYEYMFKLGGLIK